MNSDPILEVGLTRFVEGWMWSLGNGKRMTEGLAQAKCRMEKGRGGWGGGEWLRVGVLFG